MLSINLYVLLQITLLGEGDGEAERLFRTALQEFHTNLISQYSLAVQVELVDIM